MTVSLILGAGKLLWDDGLKALRARVGSERHLIVDLADPEASFSHPLATEVSREQGRLRLAFTPSSIDAARLIADVSARVAVTDLLVENPPIETVIQQLYALGGGVE